MKPSTQPPVQFLDFDNSYIISRAQQEGWRYDEVVKETAGQSGLYANEMTDTAQLHRLQFSVDGLLCEYYTAEYVPVSPLRDAVNSLAPVPLEYEKRFQVQVFSVSLPYYVEDVYIESRTNPTLNNILGQSSVYFANSKRIRLEGDFNEFFRVYVPENEEPNAFTILAPNIMRALLEDGGDYDFEFAGNRVYFYQTFKYFQGGKITLTRQAYDSLLAFGMPSARMMARAGRPTKLIDPAQNTPLWKLAATPTKSALVQFALLMGVGFFAMVCIVIPLFWPIPLALVIYYFYRRSRLKAKRRKLTELYSFS